MSKVNSLFLVSLFLLFTTGTALGQEPSQEELAKQSQNPVASLISVPFQNNTNFGIGPGDETQNILNIQPVWPFEISDNWNLITRTILPVISQTSFYAGGTSSEFGLGDTTFGESTSASTYSAATQNGPPRQLNSRLYCRTLSASPKPVSNVEAGSVSDADCARI